MPKRIFVFVYGTLREGGHYHRLMGDSKLVGHGCAPGELYSLGAYPGAKFDVDSESNIFGEIYQVTKEVLDTLDTLEGYYPGHPERSMYNRVELDFAAVDVGKVYAYHYNGEVGHRTRIKSGDWMSTGVDK